MILFLISEDIQFGHKVSFWPQHMKKFWILVLFNSHMALHTLLQFLCLLYLICKMERTNFLRFLWGWNEIINAMAFCEQFCANENGDYNLCISILVSYRSRRFNFITITIIIHFSDSSELLSSLIIPSSCVICQLNE